MIIIDNPQDFLEKLSLEGKLRDLNEEEYLAIDRISKEMQEIKREYILMENKAYISASQRPFTC